MNEAEWHNVPGIGRDGRAIRAVRACICHPGLPFHSEECFDQMHPRVCEPLADKLTFTIFRAPVSTNQQYNRVTFWRNGKKINALANSAEAEEFKAAVRSHALAARMRCSWPSPAAVKHVSVSIVVYNTKHDCSAAEKLCLDGMEGVVFENDRVAHPRTNDIGSDAGKPRVEVTVELLRCV